MKNNFAKMAVASALALSVAMPVFAATPAELIAQLQAQMAALNAQLTALKAAQQQVVSTAQDVRGTLKLLKQMREGMTGEEVTLLQTILAADTDVYPEGMITGYYGRLTSKAVRMFQKKHGFEQVGHVGPKTLEKLNKELSKHDLRKEDDDDDEDEDDDRKEKKFCIPPGHLIAPGWLKKIEREGDNRKGGERGLGNIRDLSIGVCKNATSTPPIVTPTPTATPTPTPTPTATPTPDTTAPVISAINVSAITQTSATVAWTTNEAATSRIWYALGTPLATSTALTMSDAATVTAHAFVLPSLTASTTYYYMVSSTDSAGNVGNSAEASFNTAQ